MRRLRRRQHSSIVAVSGAGGLVAVFLKCRGKIIVVSVNVSLWIQFLAAKSPCSSCLNENPIVSMAQESKGILKSPLYCHPFVYLQRFYGSAYQNNYDIFRQRNRGWLCCADARGGPLSCPAPTGIIIDTYTFLKNSLVKF